MAIVDRVWILSYIRRTLVLKTDKLSAFLRSGSRLFHSMKVNGNNKFFKKFWLVLRNRLFITFLNEYNVHRVEIKFKSYRKCLLLKNL